MHILDLTALLAWLALCLLGSLALRAFNRKWTRRPL